MQLNLLHPTLQDCGQPGFTLSERRRFGNILSQYVKADTFLHWQLFLYYLLKLDVKNILALHELISFYNVLDHKR